MGANNSSSSHTDNQENKVLVLAEGSTSVLREALVHQRKSLVLTLVKQWKNFAWFYITMVITVIYLFVKGNKWNVNFAIDSKDVSVKGNVYDFSVDSNFLLINITF